LITIKELAQLCGCSVATVNRALNDRSDVNKLTRERVIKTAREQGYRPSAMARSLARGRTRIIGLVVLDIHNPFFTQLIEHLKRALKEKDFTLHLEIMDGTLESEYHALEQLACLKPDGIIHFPLNRGEEYKTYLKQLHIPLVHLCNWLDDDFPYVIVREKEAVMRAVEHIHSYEYEEIIYLSPPLRYGKDRNIYTLKERVAGVIESSPPLPLTVIDDPNFLDRIRTLIKKGNKKSCILCSSDIFALEVLKCLREEGCLPPQDYGLMGFDNISLLKYVTPRLTTMAYPIEEIALHSLDILIGQIEGEKYTPAVLDAIMINGETV
jgi:LacI family transcriptional regulator